MTEKTLRDEFAMAALQAFVTWALHQRVFSGFDDATKAASAYSNSAYLIADAMMEARKERGE